MSGLFGFNSNDDSFGRCNCPHCRGGHGIDYENTAFFNEDGSYTFYGDEFEDGQATFDSQEVVFMGEVDDPDEMIEDYIECLLDMVEDEDDVRELMNEFFTDVFRYAMEQSYMTDIQTKIQLLSYMRNKEE